MPHPARPAKPGFDRDQVFLRDAAEQPRCKATLEEVVEYRAVDRGGRRMRKPSISIGTPSMSSATEATAKTPPPRIGLTERTVIEAGAVPAISSGPTPFQVEIWPG
jgi:hypothetical protein